MCDVVAILCEVVIGCVTICLLVDGCVKSMFVIGCSFESSSMISMVCLLMTGDAVDTLIFSVIGDAFSLTFMIFFAVGLRVGPIKVELIDLYE